MFTAAALSLLPSLFQLGMGTYQLARGYKDSKTPHPQYQIAPAMTEMVGTQKRYANGQMPGMESMLSEQRATSSNNMEAMMKLGLLNPNSVSSIYENERGVNANIGIAGANWKTGEKDKYLNALSALSAEQKAKQEWDTLLPYERTMQAASANIGAGYQNTYGAMTSAGDLFQNRNLATSMGMTLESFWKNQKHGQQSLSVEQIANYGRSLMPSNI